MHITLDQLRTYAVARSLFPPTTLRRAMHRLGFVQADPIRAPARAQDLTLRHRVEGYRAGDLERRYHQLGIEENFFINYGFVTREVQTLMHPRLKNPWGSSSWTSTQKKRAQLILEFIRERGVVHPREVDDHFAHGTVRNYWGGQSNATTHLLDAMHYQGLLRVVRRDDGIRIYATHQHEPAPSEEAARHARIDALVDVVVRLYAPMPAARLSHVVSRLRFAIPQWRGELKAAFRRAKERLAHANVAGIEWYWDADEDVSSFATPEGVRLLTPFDPIVWDRHRFEMLWRWTYRFEAYTPVAKRIRGYYAMPLLWRDRVIGWGNIAVVKGELIAEFGYVAGAPREREFAPALAEELDRMRVFLRLEPCRTRNHIERES